jgi:lipoprotein-anchoring transpeptidase ErfK/SrfK
VPFSGGAPAEAGIVSPAAHLTQADPDEQAERVEQVLPEDDAGVSGPTLGLRALVAEPRVPPVPVDSGTGRRVVYDMSDQRVWLVRANGRVLRSYLVSGSKVGNLDAGRYEVYSRSPHATGYTGTTTMDYMVRFTTGDEAAIGFHDIPVDAQGRPVQGLDELGTPTSAGCVRQRTADAKQMWAFAPVGTSVVVVD